MARGYEATGPGVKIYAVSLLAKAQDLIELVIRIANRREACR